MTGRFPTFAKWRPSIRTQRPAHLLFCKGEWHMKRALTRALAARGKQKRSIPTDERRAERTAKRAILLAGGVGTGLVAGTPCFAAEDATSSDTGGAVDEVVVTANKMQSTTVLKAPTSIQAISGD